MRDEYKAELLTYVYKGERRYRRYFYGRNSRTGGKYVKLSKVKGKPPASLRTRDGGDTTYEKSLSVADEVFRKMMVELDMRTDLSGQIRQVVALQTGKDVTRTPIADLTGIVLGRARAKKLSESQSKFLTRTLNDFAKFAASKRVQFVYQIDEALVDDYLETIKCFANNLQKNKISTISGAVKLVCPFFQVNPFQHALDIIKSNKKAVTQDQYQPFTNDQLNRILGYGKHDELSRYLVSCCAFTGLRISDACTLRWNEVDMKAGLITRKCIKTGEMVYPPITPSFKRELESALLKCDDNEEFVCPEAAQMYDPKENRINVLGKKLLARALFGNTPEEAIIPDEKQPGLLDVKAAIEATNFTDTKKARLWDTYERYRDGQSYREIERQTGRSRGTTNGYLAILEELMKVHIRPMPRKGPTLSEMVRMTQTKGTSGMNRRSIYSWHSFRTTYVTKLLLHGVEPTVAQQYVGHTSVQMTLKYLRTNKKLMADLRRQDINDPLREIYLGSQKEQTANLLADLSQEQKAALLEQLLKERQQLPAPNQVK